MNEKKGKKPPVGSFPTFIDQLNIKLKFVRSFEMF